MKFGHNLSRNQVPEWASSYINYKGLKKLIKAAVSTNQHGESSPDLAEFWHSLERNLEVVDEFYTKKQQECTRQLRLLKGRYGSEVDDVSGMDEDELDDLLGSLLELRGQMRKLQWYSDINRRGFVKITKKLDKKVPGSNAQTGFLGTRLEPRGFVSNFELLADMKEVNEWMGRLGGRLENSESGSTTSTTDGRLATGTTNGSITPGIGVFSRTIPNLSPELGAAVELAVRTDSPEALGKALEDVQKNQEFKDLSATSSNNFQKLLLGLLQRAISSRSSRCISHLVPEIKSLEEPDDIHHRNCIHRLVISIGRSKNKDWTRSTVEPQNSSIKSETKQFLSPATLPTRAPLHRKKSEAEKVHGLNDITEPGALLSHILSLLKSEEQRKALREKDLFGRFPLHYAAEFGLSVVCETLLRFMEEWRLLKEPNGLKEGEWLDTDNLSPLHLSVMNKHAMTTKVLLEVYQQNENFRSGIQTADSRPVLAIAVENSTAEILTVLVKAGFDVNYQDMEGETALHTAAKLGLEEFAQVLLESRTINVDIPEKTFGWTPLFVATVNGNLHIVELLIQKGADPTKYDTSGWTPKEHAALRGFIKVAEYLGEHEGTATRSEANGLLASNGNAHHTNLAATKAAIKTFGHRYLQNETMVLLSLGSMDTRNKREPVELDAIPLSSAHSTQLDTALSVVVSAIGASGEAVIIDLPPQENISTEPISFMTKDESKVKLVFDIVPTYAGTSNEGGIIGRGVALLSSVRTSMGAARMNLRGDVIVPIMAAKTLEIIGSVNFNFLVIKPFSHPNMSISEDRTYWTKPVVIGHRGFGKNVSSRKSLQLGENTIESFIVAANLGASYVEFDVQLTKDLTPVIYHDFLVSETGIDAPVHLLTKEQFLHLGEQYPKSSVVPSQSAQGSASRELPQTVVTNDGVLSGNTTSNSENLASRDDPDSTINTVTSSISRPRSFSVGSSSGTADALLAAASNRMKYTRDFQANMGYKPNMYGMVVKAPFITLSEMFTAKEMPPHVGFNIEVKYPTLLESEQQEMDSYSIEINNFVDKILETVYDNLKPGGRHIIFSSFHPDVCLLLALKQPSIPVLFLTDAGCAEMGDVRCESLQQAIRFASRWNLLGIVSAAEPLVMCPRLVRVVKESGLVCVSYGTLNNEPENVKIQVNEGIDAVIVDKVAAFRQGLTDDE